MNVSLCVCVCVCVCVCARAGGASHAGVRGGLHPQRLAIPGKEYICICFWEILRVYLQ